MRHESEGGGNHGDYASRRALKMVRKHLSLDLKENRIAVGIVWDDGGGMEFSYSGYILRSGQVSHGIYH